MEPMLSQAHVDDVLAHQLQTASMSDLRVVTSQFRKERKSTATGVFGIGFAADSATDPRWPSFPLPCGEGFYRTFDSVAPAPRIHRFHGIVVGRLRRELVKVHAEDRASDGRARGFADPSELTNVLRSEFSPNYANSFTFLPTRRLEASD